MNVTLFIFLVGGTAAVAGIFALICVFRRSEQDRRSRWIGSRHPLPDADFVNQSGVRDEELASAALRVRDIVAAWAGLPQLHIHPGVSLADLSRLEWDGANGVELGLALEEAFTVTIEQAALQEIRTVRDLVSYVLARRKKT
jgi:acyl carrier protein